MRSWKRVLGGALSNGYGAKNRITGRPDGLRILMYHSVTADPTADCSDTYIISKNRFTDHLDYLADNCADPNLSVRPFCEIDKVGVAITFDDGYYDNLAIAAPLLITRGFPFHVFVNPSFIISRDRKYLDTRSLSELAALPGVTIGAHGYSHKKLTECSKSELEYELLTSKSFLEDILGMQVNTMAYPHGAFNKYIQSVTTKTGFELAASSQFGLTTVRSDKLALERTDIWSHDTRTVFRSKLNGNWDWMKHR